MSEGRAAVLVICVDDYVSRGDCERLPYLQTSSLVSNSLPTVGLGAFQNECD